MGFQQNMVNDYTNADYFRNSRYFCFFLACVAWLTLGKARYSQICSNKFNFCLFNKSKADWHSRVGALLQCNPFFAHDDLPHLFLACYINLGMTYLLAGMFAALF